jgi:hypothetical protein
MSIFNKVINGKTYHFRGIVKTRQEAKDRCKKIRESGYEAIVRESLAKSQPGYIIWGR